MCSMSYVRDRQQDRGRIIPLAECSNISTWHEGHRCDNRHGKYCLYSSHRMIVGFDTSGTVCWVWARLIGRVKMHEAGSTSELCLRWREPCGGWSWAWIYWCAGWCVFDNKSQQKLLRLKSALHFHPQFNADGAIEIKARSVVPEWVIYGLGLGLE